MDAFGAGKRDDYVTPPSGLVIHHDGFFDVDRFHEELRGWFFKKRYDYIEKEVQIKNKPQGREYVFGMNGEREVDEFFKFHVQFKVFSIRTQKLKEGGYSGWVKLNIKAWIELDWTKRWQKNSWTRFLYYGYVNFIIKDRIIRTYESKLYLEMLEAIGIAKSCMREVYH